MRSKLILIALLLVVSSSGYAQDFGIELAEDSKSVLTRRQQAVLMNRLLKHKQKIILPQVMRETEIDMWIVSEGEGHLYLSLIESGEDGDIPTTPSYLVFFDKGDESTVERLSSRFEDLADIIKSRNPKKIGINVTESRSLNRTFPESEEADLKQEIGGKFVSRIVSARILTNRWLGTRTPEELSVFKHVVRLAHEVIAEAFSNRVVVPDFTTTDDLNWWIRQRYADLGLGTVDHPTITVQRSMAEGEKYDDDDEYFRIFDERFVDNTSPRAGLNIIIRRGDIIFCDTGIKYLGLYTDTQQSAYVLKEGETDAPEGIKEALRHIVRFQDLVGEEMRLGRNGSEIGSAAAERARQEGIEAKIYAHALSYYYMRYGILGGFFSQEVHFAGSGISSSTGRRNRRANPLRYNTLFAMELDIEYNVPEWDGQRIVVFSETAMTFSPRGMEFPGGRETEWYLIK